MIEKTQKFFARWAAALALVLTIPSYAANRDSSRWEKDIAAFEAADRTSPPAKGGVLFVGSSSIRLWNNLSEAFPTLQTVQRGFGGAHLPDVIAFADRIVLPYEPAAIVLYAGENDLARGDSPQEVFDAFKEFAGIVRERLPRTEIYFISIKPSPSRWHLSPQQKQANRMIRRYCAWRRGLEYIDIWPALLAESGQPDPGLFQNDKLHLNEKGYAKWADIIRPVLAEYEKR